MINRVDISSAYIIEEQIINTLYSFNNFTLTVNAVNDAPVLLRPHEDHEIVLKYSGAATMVQNIVFDVVHPIFKFL